MTDSLVGSLDERAVVALESMAASFRDMAATARVQHRILANHNPQHAHDDADDQVQDDDRPRDPLPLHIVDPSRVRPIRGGGDDG
jgi:hypothetical protein